MRLLNLVSGITVALSLALAGTLAQGAQEQQQRGMQRDGILETARGTGQFNTLVQALEKSGLAQELERGGPYTIFAPTDAAFNKLGKQKVNDLMKPENKDQLAEILKYHVVRGEVKAGDVSGKRMRAETLEGGRLQINAKDRRVVRINEAQVTQPDIPAQNGVIHAVDEVLMPKG
ncbi:MAG: fasciclin domain-containing protein [Alphaproteobacteria bacterium]